MKEKATRNLKIQDPVIEKMKNQAQRKNVSSMAALTSTPSTMATNPASPNLLNVLTATVTISDNEKNHKQHDSKPLSMVSFGTVLHSIKK